jgi:hypothetical protein
MGQVAAHQAEHVDDGDELALVEAEIEDGCDEGDVFQPDALPKKAHECEHRERSHSGEVERLRADVVAHVGACSSSSGKSNPPSTGGCAGACSACA